MTDQAFLTMLIVLALVWGGFAVLLVSALRREKHKRGQRRDDDTPRSDQPGPSITGQTTPRQNTEHT
jgi:hypothetical protein